MGRILVTGGAGFIGSHVCEMLLRLGHDVLCVDNFNDYYDSSFKRSNLTSCQSNPRFAILETDIRDINALLGAVSDSKVDQVIHLAARAGVIPSIEDPGATFENNVVGTQNVLEMCRMKSIPRLVLASSSSVYGSRESGPFKETDRVSSPESPYAASKIMNEIMAHAYHKAYGLGVICLRFFTVYGPRQRPDMAIHTFVRKLITRNELDVYGKPSTARDYTYIDDIISGVSAAVELGSGFNILNLGNSKPVLLGDLVNVIINKTGTDVDVEWLSERVGDVPLTYADLSRAEELLNYRPKTSIEKGVELFVEWYRNSVH